MNRAAPTPALLLLLPLLALGSASCDNKSQTDASSNAEGAPPEKKNNKETVDALLRENGIDPSTIPDASAPGSAAPVAGNPAGVSPQPPAEPKAPHATVSVVNPGAGAKQVLAYTFKQGRVLKFAMDMAIEPTRVVNGQAAPGIPPVKIAMSGTTETLSVGESTAQRLNTFAKFTPATDSLPAELVQQMQAQFSGLEGVQLIETVSRDGHVLDMQIKEGTVNNPQVLSLMQNLQDGMSNAFLPLPTEPVGVGATWQSITPVETAGLSITQINGVKLKSISGSKLTVELTFKQEAKPQEILGAGLPPGAKVELLAMDGGGSGTMTVDLNTLITDSRVELGMKVDTRISGAGTPEPITSSTNTKMKIHIVVSE